MAMFENLESERLVIRAFAMDDAPGLETRRNEPEVAQYQNWQLPFGAEQSNRLVASLVEMDGPTNDDWWMAIVADRATGKTMGDLAVHLSWEGRAAEIGYTFHRAYWGAGYAVEAVGMLVEYLFDECQVTRIFGMLHPDNPASAMVMERNGFLFEGHTRSSFWLGDEVSDDWIYGLLLSDWEEWRKRPQGRPDLVRLEDVTVENEGDVFRLKTHKTQEKFVAPMSGSFADALFPEVVDGEPLVPLMKGVFADNQYAGFVMLALPTAAHPEPYLWRLLIDRMHQRRGIGRRALDLVVEFCRDLGVSTLVTSWVEGKGSPGPFYQSYGFIPTGRIVDGETEARLIFD